MLVLISNDFKALRIGAHVESSDQSGEFILDTENCELAIATLLEIAAKNKFSLKKGKKQEMVSSIEASILDLNLKEMNEMSDTNKVKEIVLEGFEKQISDEDMLMQIVQAGIPFRNAMKYFRTCVEENGLRISAKKRVEEVDQILEESEFFPTTFEDVQAMAERIAVGDSKNDLVAVDDTTTTQAIKLIKKFLKAKEIEFPKAKKQPKGGLRLRFLEYAAINPQSTDSELFRWVVDNTDGKSDHDLSKFFGRYINTINHGRSVARYCIENDVSPCVETVETDVSPCVETVETDVSPCVETVED